MRSRYKIVGILVCVAVFLIGWGMWRQRQTTSRQPQTAVLVVTPKMFQDFAQPKADIHRLYDTYQTQLNKADNQIIVLAVGSGDHIWGYQPDHQSQKQTITCNWQALVSRAGGQACVLPEVIPVISGAVLSWDWQVDNLSERAVRMRVKMKETVTGLESFLTYAVGSDSLSVQGAEITDLWLGQNLPYVTAEQIVSIYQDAYRLRAKDQYDHSFERQNWVITGFETWSESGQPIKVGALSFTTQAEVNWARNVFALHKLNWPEDRLLPYVRQFRRPYPQTLNLPLIKKIVQSLREVAKEYGWQVKIYDAIESGDEFTAQPWKYYDHPEVVLAPVDHAGDSFSLIDLSTQVSGSEQTAGNYLAQQSAKYVTDLGFDGLYAMNGFGLAGQWYPRGYLSRVGNTAAVEFYRKFKQLSRRHGEVLWMDSYYPVVVEKGYWGATDELYTQFDQIQISSFWYDDLAKPVFGWVSNNQWGGFGETIRSKLALRQRYGQTKITWTMYLADPWYPKQEPSANVQARWQHLKVVEPFIDGVVWYIQDWQGNFVPLAGPAS